MNNAQLQEAIDKTRIWLNSPQFPSLKAKEDAVLFLTEMMKIQVVRASAPTQPKLMKGE